MANQKIFFSYSRADGSPFALRLAIDLKQKGYDVWIDQEDIRAGLEWDAEIEKGLETCDSLLFLATEKSVVSNNVLDEVYYALEQHKKVIPLVFVDSKIPFRLNRLQRIDFTKDYDTALTSLLNELEGNTPDISDITEGHTSVHYRQPLPKNYKVWAIVGCLALVVVLLVAWFRKDNNEGSLAVKDRIASDSTIGNTGSVPVNITDVAGDWDLQDIEPPARSHRGYLHIEMSGENKASIKGYMQFYYPDSKAEAYPVVFNAFVSCLLSTLKREVKLKVEDISVSSRSIKRAREDQPDGKMAGDTISDVSSTKSIQGTALLQFVGKNKAVIKMTRTEIVDLNDELKLEPFIYTFNFRKKE